MSSDRQLANALSDLDAETVRGLLDYEPDTGVLRWKRSLNTRIRVGAIAGVRTNGYVHISINGRKYKAHRLAWLHYYGEWPSLEIDHINRVRDDNRIANLRNVPSKVNSFNRRYSQNGSVRRRGLLFQARVGSGTSARHTYLGTFQTEADAREAVRLHVAEMRERS